MSRFEEWHKKEFNYKSKEYTKEDIETANQINSNICIQNLEGEIWKDVPDYEGLYQISNLGRVKCLGNGKSNRSTLSIMRPSKSRRDYLKRSLTDKNGNNKSFMIHRLVAKTFLNLDVSNKKLVVDHINNIPYDNRVINLQVITQRENTLKNPSQKKEGGGNRGVYITSNGTWKSQIMFDKKVYFLGTYKLEQQAEKAYSLAFKYKDKVKYVESFSRFIKDIILYDSKVENLYNEIISLKKKNEVLTEKIKHYE